jgi:hypothetical protein
MKFRILLIFGSINLIFSKKDKFFYCQTCAALIEESFYKVSQVDAKKTINTGSSRIDPNGEMKERKKQWRLSETHLTEVFETVCKGIANDWVVEVDPDNSNKFVKRMTTFDGAMNTDINYQNLMDQKAEDPDKPPSHDVLKIRWTCENILEEIEEDMIDAFQTLEDDESAFDEEKMIEFCCLDSGVCSEEHHDEL